MKHETIENIIIPVPENYHDCFVLIKSDAYRTCGRNLPIWRIFLISCFEPATKFLFWHRLTQYQGSKYNFFYYFAKWRHRHYMFKYGLMIASSTKIGYGFLIGHPCGIIVNHSAIIGNNVNLSQFTTIGSNEGQAAIIGDNVYIGPSCCLVENVVIGHDVTIGAGSVVTHSIPDCTVAAGNPARVIESHLPVGKYVGNRWPIQTN